MAVAVTAATAALHLWRFAAKGNRKRGFFFLLGVGAGGVGGGGGGGAPGSESLFACCVPPPQTVARMSGMMCRPLSGPSVPTSDYAN